MIDDDELRELAAHLGDDGTISADSWCRVAQRPTRDREVLAVVQYRHDWRQSLMPGLLVCGACGAFCKRSGGDGG